MLPGMKWKKRIHCSLPTGAQQTQYVSKHMYSLLQNLQLWHSGENLLFNESYFELNVFGGAIVVYN
jgi:hypothetical protein